MLTFHNRPLLKRTCIAASLFVLSLGLYLSVSRPYWSGDTLPAAYLPLSILDHGTLYLNYYPSLYNAAATKAFPHNPNGTPYYLILQNGHYVSSYSPWSAFLAVPVYAVPLLSGVHTSRTQVLQWARITASLITALSVVVLFFALGELVPIGWAAVIAIVYAFGTTAFSVTSQAMWEHGPSALFLTLGLLFLVKGEKDESALPYGGLSFSIAVMMRYTDALIALVVALYILHKHRRILGRYLLLSSFPAFLIFAYNHWYLGSVFQTGYFQATPSAITQLRATPLWQGLAGVLFSPARGLFVYSPIFLLSLLGLGWIWRNGPIFFRYLAVGMMGIIVICSKWFMWWGGYCYGPRLLADIAPLLCSLLYPLGRIMRKRVALALSFVLLVSVSFGMNAIGAYWYNSQWDIQADVWKNPTRLWSWENSPFAYYGHYPYWDMGQLTRDIGIHRAINAAILRMLRPLRAVKRKQAFRSFPTSSFPPWPDSYLYAASHFDSPETSA